MTRKTAVSPDLSNGTMTTQPLPAPARSLPEDEILYIGIDIGKKSHVAGFVSDSLLQRYERFTKCPIMPVPNGRLGFTALAERIASYVSPDRCMVLLEHTGHFHHAVRDYLHDLGICVYTRHVQKRDKSQQKTDKHDALSLANDLFNQIGKGVQVKDPKDEIKHQVAPTESAARLKGIVRHRYELEREQTRCKNKLTAICDQLFPEFASIIKDVNCPSALAIRDRYPSALELAEATDADLRTIHVAKRIGQKGLKNLRCLAETTVGVRDPLRREVLLLEQPLLITQLRLIEHQIDILDATIARLVDTSREGQIVMSIPGIGHITAGTLIAAIGSIKRFPTAAKLKTYCGCGIIRTQTGTSVDTKRKTKGGVKVVKSSLWLMYNNIVMHHQDSEWAQLRDRLYAKPGKRDVRTRVINQVVSMVWMFLRRDYDLVASLPPGQPLPPPMQYDPAVHHAHCTGHYRPAHTRAHPRPLEPRPPDHQPSPAVA